MKWINLAVLLCAFQSAPLFTDEPIADGKPAVAAEPKAVTSIEDKLKRLEQDAGIEIEPETTSFIFFVDFLYWKASLDGVAYATTAVAEPSPGGGEVFDKFKTRAAHFDYSPGFQIGLGVGLPHDHWDLTVQWLRMFTTGTDEARSSTTRVVFDTIGTIAPLTVLPNKVKADCQLGLNILDLNLGRTLLWSRYFWFHPFAGIRAAWLAADWHIKFTTPGTPPYSKLDVDNHYSGIGFVGGFDSRWNVYKGFGLFSHASASLIYGRSSENTDQEIVDVPPVKQKLSAHNSTYAVKGIFDIAAGLKWEMEFKSKNAKHHHLKNPPMHHFIIWAGYEFIYWPNVTQKTIVQSMRTRDRADLSYEGLTIGARIDY